MSEKKRVTGNVWKLGNRDRQQAFLEAVRATGVVGDGIKAAKVSLSAAYRFRDRHPEFAKQWDAAVKQGEAAWPETLLQSTRYRAVRDRLVPAEITVDFLPTPTPENPNAYRERRRVSKWKTIHASDQLAALHLKATFPETFGDAEKALEARMQKIEIYSHAIELFQEEVRRRARVAGKKIEVTREEAVHRLSKKYPDIYKVLGYAEPKQLEAEATDAPA